MIKLGANTVLFAGYDLETALKHLAWAGYDGVELSAIKGMCEHLVLDEYQGQVSRIKELAAQYKLELLAVEVASLEEERLQKAFAAAAALGIPVVNVGPGGKTGVAGDIEKQATLIDRLADQAAGQGVKLCVKAHVGCCVDNTPTTLRLMELVRSRGFAVDMDPSHIYRAGENPVEALRAVVSRVGHVHIRDCIPREGGPGAPELQSCGRGHIDLAGYVKVLHEAGLSVAADLEIIGAKDYELSRATTIAAESRGYLNACLKACGAR
jgi:sugar phosphate isomerase/epimerase